MYKIDNFRGRYFFLSNFYPAVVEYEGLTYKSSEAAFQAAKTLSEKERRKFTLLNPSESKREGRRVKLRADWESVKNQVMYDVVYDKFTRDPDLKHLLIMTQGIELVEGNTWGEVYWGVCEGRGDNMLGKILMQVRDKLIEDEGVGLLCEDNRDGRIKR